MLNDKTHLDTRLWPQTTEKFNNAIYGWQTLMSGLFLHLSLKRTPWSDIKCLKKEKHIYSLISFSCVKIVYMERVVLVKRVNFPTK